VLKTVQAIASKNYHSVPQGKDEIGKHAPKIFKDTCEINWEQTDEHVRNFVRGLNPYPSAWTRIEGKAYKIHKVSLVDKAEDKKAGEFSTDNKQYLHFKTGQGWIAIDELQPEGKKRMNIQDFFRGNKL
jgi:methionyl-tRNA formyltransferase